MNLTDLGRLLNDGVSPGTLATAIETHGVDGWDRYGRLKHFEPGSKEAHEALDLLARQAAYDGEPGVQSPVDEAAGYGNSPFGRFGWLDGRLPDLAAIGDGEIKVPRPQSVAKANNANLAIIEYLLRFIRGDLTQVAHPDSCRTLSGLKCFRTTALQFRA